MSNQAYLQGVAEALSQMNIDPQIKVASYNELEKVAAMDPGTLQALENLAREAELAQTTASSGALPALPITQAPTVTGGGRVNQLLTQAESKLAPTKLQNILSAAKRNKGKLGLGAGALALGAGALGMMGDDEEEERQRNLALALGGTALAGGLGYGAYKAMS